MLKWSNFTLSTIGLLMLSASLSAQTAQPKSSSTDKVQPRLVTASAAGESIRFASLGELIQMRVEVIGTSGETLFDSDFKPGNLIDWPGSDSKGQRLADGAYLCVVTVKDASGQITRRQAVASVHDHSFSLRQSDTTLLSAAQAQAAGSIADEDVSLTILEPGQSSAAAVLGHDGGKAHLVSGSGGLSISSGDFFANKIIEHIRVTVEGDVGIGISNPQAKLDVAGTIRASQGIIFPDGSIQFSAASKTLGAKSTGPDQILGGKHKFQTETAGTGTAGRIAKWIDNSANLGDSSIIETLSGGVNVATFGGQPTGSSNNHIVEMIASGTKSPLTLVGGSGEMEFWKDQAGGGGLPTAAVAFGMAQPGVGSSNDMVFSAWNGSSWAERMRMTNGGNVGIGTTAPGSALDVVGNINTSTQYNIAGGRILSNAGTNNLFAGISSGANNTGVANAFFGTFTGQANTSGGSNSFIGSSAGFSNTFGTDNSFVGTSAGSNNTAGSRNSFVGSFAGFGNTSGINNSFFGAQADGLDGLSNATAIGFNAFVQQSNSLVLGSVNGFHGATASTNVGIGTTAPLARLDVRGNLFLGLTAAPNSGGQNALFIGNDGGDANNSLRIDGGSNDLTIIARSAPGSAAGTSISFRTAPAGVGDLTRMRINPTGTVEILGDLTVSGTFSATLPRGSRRAALDQFWTPTSTDGLGLTTVGSGPELVKSDGADLWVANFTSATVSRVRASDGKLLETWTGATNAFGVLAAKGLIFVTGTTSPGKLYQIDPTQPAGAVTTLTSALGNTSQGIAFDGARIWTANAGSPGSVSIVTLNPFSVTTGTEGFSSPRGILYDGANMWVTDDGFSTGKLFKLDSNGAIIQTVTVGDTPRFPVFDGTNIWVPNFGFSNTVTVVRASTGAILATLTGNGLNSPFNAAFDGERILVTNFFGNSVSLWKAADLSPLGVVSTGAGTESTGACSDGLNFWITLRGTHKLARF